MTKSNLTLKLLQERTNHKQAILCMCRNDVESPISTLMGDYFVVIGHSERYGFHTADGQYFKYAIPVQVVELKELVLNENEQN